MKTATCRIARRPGGRQSRSIAIGAPTGGRQAFTLVEALCSTVIVGLAAAAILVSTASSTRVNSSGQNLTEAVFLAQELREWTLSLPFADPDPGDQGNPPGPDGSEDPQTHVDDLDDLMDVTFSPPRDGQGNPVPGMAGWSQTVAITWRDPNNISSTVAAGSSEVVYVSVSIAFQGSPVHQTGWLVAER